ncbi:hypothetical protein Tph_c10380 [Thermacetogenium phaeum DSM 12270]|jgi:hypothetical protein|uniref:Carbohydrate binding module family 25 domain-containing protein n=2 Tax=Thermacetogenium phaeum TaxID=85874 RepID=K4LDZ5_THEPS|nr:carbohydrate-binding protein [Thermacetogenium phaeum]AFV11261.1 hypothetical protein Tph_c10380 [Thermacetogenium phaeum DSM 12270]MDN5365958.1 hypothetical protein [Thermacetogenium sp.]
MYNLHPGFTISPVPSKVGEKCKIRYHGLLATSGADQVWLRTGYGTGPWQNIYDYRMNKVGPNEWEQTVEITREGQFNFCFKDSANNWDNNNGLNWSYTIRR